MERYGNGAVFGKIRESYCTLYWDASLKSKNLGKSACIKHAFWPFLDYGLNAASKTENFGLNASAEIMRKLWFNIEILINRNLVNIFKI